MRSASGTAVLIFPDFNIRSDSVDIAASVHAEILGSHFRWFLMAAVASFRSSPDR